MRWNALKTLKAHFRALGLQFALNFIMKRKPQLKCGLCCISNNKILLFACIVPICTVKLDQSLHFVRH